MLEERDFSHSGLSPQNLLGQPVTDSHYTEVIERSSYVYLDKDKPVVYLNLDDPRLDAPLPYLERIRMPNSTRKALGDNNLSLSFGALTAKENRSADCNIASLINKDRELESLLRGGYSVIADRLMSTYLPQWHKVNHALFRKSGIDPSWQMANTFWPSGIINKNSQHNFHFDDANGRNFYSAMFTLKNRMSGGYLVMPQYNIAFAVSNRSLIFFCGKEILHGVSPMYIQQGGHRYSIVYFTPNGMKLCKSHREETSI